MSAMMRRTPGYGTEYNENYLQPDTQRLVRMGFRTNDSNKKYPVGQTSRQESVNTVRIHERDPTDFHSSLYPSIYRQERVPRDDRGKYQHANFPTKDIANKAYGRRLMYDQSHPENIYPSQWNSELADTPGMYSFPTTTGLRAEQPWAKSMAWRQEGEVGEWPSQTWQTWCSIAQCPQYDGFSDQPEYSKYKVQI